MQIIEIARHPEFVRAGGFAHLPTGRNAAHVDARTLTLEKYLTADKLPPIPAASSVADGVAEWPMYGNNLLGDCTCAAAGHMIAAWTADAGKPDVPADADVELAYWKTGKPSAKCGEPGGATDCGRVELDVLKFWRKSGVAGHKIAAFASIDPKDPDRARAACYLFGGLYLGLALPRTAQRQHLWDVVGDGKRGDSRPGSWAGHAVNVVAYDDEGVTVITWGAPLKATWRFLDVYCEEAYALLSGDWLAANGSSTGGFNLAELNADLAKVAG